MAVKNHYDVVIVGAGAAGLFCAFNAAQKGLRVLVLDHANKVGKKILMSGGGRCNFTNLNTSFEDFTCENPHFCKSALMQYSAYDFLSLVESHQVDYVEKAAGQLFCKDSSKDILKMLLDECGASGVKIYKKCTVHDIQKNEAFALQTSLGVFSSHSLVIATGGLSIPTLGATGFGYDIAKQFGHEIVPTSASLVPFTLSAKLLKKLNHLSGLSLKVQISVITDRQVKVVIEEDLLFTHRGLSGPAILKISAYWQYGQAVEINLLPAINVQDYLQQQRLNKPEQLLTTSLSRILPKRLALYLCGNELADAKLKHINSRILEFLNSLIHNWKVTPSGTEGYKTAEVTSGGISVGRISSKTFESSLQKRLYFIGEVLDVTGQLGGYNFQWAWSSGWCAAQNMCQPDTV
ncbi:Uncharacterized protein YhiN [hydrothermal vent metagenome]|uniref:Uncharacterized protein YhiN n=1 Tax=hydrothermal vent metagenome TaxID=652676 RepID=A0A3B0XDH6_9ZZZZ